MSAHHPAAHGLHLVETLLLLVQSALLLGLLVGLPFLGFALVDGFDLSIYLSQDCVALLTGSNRRLLVGGMCDNAHVVQSEDSLDVANPYFLAVNSLVGALKRNAVLGVLAVVLKCE